MGQRQGFREIFVERQRGGHRARDLCHLDGVRQAVPEMVAEAWREYLGLGFQPAEGARMHDAVAVALKGVAVRMRRFRVTPPQAAFHRKTEMAEHGLPGYWGGNSAYAWMAA